MTARLKTRSSSKARGSRRPSEEKDAFFIRARASRVQYPSHTERSGKWLLFIAKQDVDEVWQRIRTALIAGKLGNSAKVSTVRPNSNSTDAGKHVICVYTYDCEDREDVMRIRASLRELGFVSPIAYKTDLATDGGRYKVLRHRRISKYYE